MTTMTRTMRRLFAQAIAEGQDNNQSPEAIAAAIELVLHQYLQTERLHLSPGMDNQYQKGYRASLDWLEQTLVGKTELLTDSQGYTRYQARKGLRYSVRHIGVADD